MPFPAAAIRRRCRHAGAAAHGAVFPAGCDEPANDLDLQGIRWLRELLWPGNTARQA